MCKKLDDGSATPMQVRYLISNIELQWRHNERDGVSNRLFAQPFVQAQIKENIKAPRYWLLWGESAGDRGEFPHKGPVTRKMFSFDDVIMDYVTWTGMLFPSAKMGFRENLFQELDKCKKWPSSSSKHIQ